MASLRVIRRRLRSIHNTKQIMRAMQLVSASKLKRAQGRLLQARLILEFLDGLLERVLAAAPPARPSREPGRAPLEHALCRQSEGRPDLLVIFTSDTGLCGSYNTNLIQLAESHLRRDTAKGTKLIYVGKKGHRYFTRRGYASEEAFIDLAGRPHPAKADAIGRSLMERFLAGHVSGIRLLYSEFRSSTVYRPTILPWLPITLAPPVRLEGQPGRARTPPLAHQEREYIFEPSPRRVFEDLLPRWALATFQRVMLEAFTSEHRARMIAMKNATDNAEELLTSLTLERNKVRQAAITKEISEIVGTAEALK
jgi:F-type H+-transporting ATPase subunit gamma